MATVPPSSAGNIVSTVTAPVAKTVDSIGTPFAFIFAGLGLAVSWQMFPRLHWAILLFVVIIGFGIYVSHAKIIGQQLGFMFSWSGHES